MRFAAASDFLSRSFSSFSREIPRTRPGPDRVRLETQRRAVVPALDGARGTALYLMIQPVVRSLLVRKWRNWQTRKPQELVAARQWRFKSSLPHQPTLDPAAERASVGKPKRPVHRSAQREGGLASHAKVVHRSRAAAEVDCISAWLTPLRSHFAALTRGVVAELREPDGMLSSPGKSFYRQ